MAKLTIDDWHISSDSFCWMLCRRKDYKHGPAAIRPTYHATLRQALQALVERDLRESDLEGVEAVMERLKALQASLKGVLG